MGNEEVENQAAHYQALNIKRQREKPRRKLIKRSKTGHDDRVAINRTQVYNISYSRVWRQWAGQRIVI